MKIQLKLNLDKNFLIAVGAPLITILIVFISIFISKLGVNPQTDFLYYTCESYCYGDVYEVTDGRLTEVVQEAYPEELYDYYSDYNAEATIYRYSISSGENTELSLAEASALALDDAKKSPDGYTLDRKYSAAIGFPFYFGASDFSKYALVSKSGEKTIELETYYGEMTFIGWVIE